MFRMNYERDGIPGIVFGLSDRNLNLLLEGMPFFIDNSDLGFDGVTMLMYSNSLEELQEYVKSSEVNNPSSRLGPTKIMNISPAVVKTLKSGEIVYNETLQINDQYPVEILFIYRPTDEDIVKALTEELGFEIEGLL